MSERLFGGAEMNGKHGESKSSSLVVHPVTGDRADIATTDIDTVRNAINERKSGIAAFTTPIIAAMAEFRKEIAEIEQLKQLEANN